jgi:ABC-type antimicrobial peptide transport system permease subunit
LRNPVKAAVYLPYTVKMWMFTQILVRARVPPLTILRAVRAQLIQVDAEQQAMRVRDLNGWITMQREYAQQRLVAMLFGIFSALALLLAAVGLYSVVSYGVASRTNEFGVRMALGARRADVIRVVLAATAVNVGGGVAAGVVLSLVLDRIETKWVTESSGDPLLLLGVSLLLILAASLACFLPARRAASVDPMVALRYE